MNPYDPNDALSDKSEEYIPGDTLTTIDETPEEFPIDQLKLELGRMQAVINQKSTEFLSGEEFMSGEITSDESTYVIKFNDPNNEIDYGETSGETSGENPEGNSRANSGANTSGEEMKDEFTKYLVESDGETHQTTGTETETSNMAESYLEEIKKAFEATSDEGSFEDTLGRPSILKTHGSNELINILEEAKSLFEPPDKPKVRILEAVKSEKQPACPMTSSGLELQEIETKLRECHLVKSQNFNKDVRLNQLTLRDKSCKPEESQRDIPSSELEVRNPNQARNNFCELLYRSAFLSNPDDVSFPPSVQQDQRTLQSVTPVSEDLSKPNHVDDFVILSRAVQLLESRPSSHSIPTNCRGILGILALQQKLKDLTSDKEELENRLYKCNSDFTEFIDILSDKARIICINNKEVANFIKILNLKVPELEKITAAHTESLEDIKYRFKERNVAKIIELRKQIEFYTLNIDKLIKKIAKINSENVDIKRQMEGLDIDNLHYKTYFTKKVEEVRANMDNLQSLNNELQRQLELIQNSDLGKNENFKLKVPSLKEEIENISSNIKQVRRDKNKYELENTELRKKLKSLILAKVMEKRASGATSPT